MIKNPTTQPMNEQQIELALILLEQALKDKKIDFEHANPMQENCYISSSYIIGVYFPNTTLKLTNDKHQSYKIACISRVGGELGLVFALKDNTSEPLKRLLSEFIFEPFNDILYSYEHRLVKERIENRLNKKKQELATANNVERNTRKNGEPFKHFLHNYKNVRLDTFYDGTISSYIVVGSSYNSNLTLYRDREMREKEPTIHEFETLLKREKVRIETCIKEYEKSLKQLDQKMKKFEKLVKNLQDFIDTCINKNDFLYLIREQYILK